MGLFHTRTDYNANMETLPTLTFRRARADDLAAMRALWPEQTLEACQAWLAQRTRWITLAHQGDRLAAGGELARAGRTVEIANLIVLPAWRRRGVGRALVAHLCDLARHFRARRVQLTVDPSNLPALRLYAACGFETVGLLPLTPSHLLIMEKRL
jgi:GNAT superfamily N-acetyltransferase